MTATSICALLFNSSFQNSGHHYLFPGLLKGSPYWPLSCWPLHLVLKPSAYPKPDLLLLCLETSATLCSLHCIPTPNCISMAPSACPDGPSTPLTCFPGPPHPPVPHPFCCVPILFVCLFVFTISCKAEFKAYLPEAGTHSLSSEFISFFTLPCGSITAGASF